MAKKATAPGGLSFDEWCDYWKEGKDSYLADGMSPEQMREDLAFASTAMSDLLAACKALLHAARDLRGEAVITHDVTAKTLEPMFAADDLAQAAILKAGAEIN